MPHSVWRRVRARVHLSLTPVELSNPVRSATKKAFSSLLMRYSPELGGAVVAHIGPVELCGPPVFVDASPFAHVAAVANLLVFAPRKGTELLGVVTHVGPDHLGLSVLSAFHAVLPIDDLEDVYRFESKYTRTTTVHMWKRIDGPDHVTVRRQLRFVISELKPTRTGLFQIIASLDPNLRQNPNASHPLGLIPREKEIALSTQSLQQDSDTVEAERSDVLQVTKRRASRANEHLTGDELLAAGNDMLGDALLPTGTPVSALKKKKRRRFETEQRSVSFEDSDRQRQDKKAQRSSEQPQSQETVSQEVEGTEGKADGEKGDNDAEKVEKSDRKKRKKEKKKKKKRSSSGDGEKRRESNGSIKARKDGHEEDGADSSLPAETKQEEQRATNEVTTSGNGGVRKDPKEQESEGHRSHRRKSKKKRKEKDRSADGDTGVVVKREGEAEGRDKDKDGEKVNREVSMRRDAEKAVELGPMGDQGKKDDNEESERDTEERRKKKKKRRRSSGGETDEHRSKKKKKRKKRMSEAMELERRRSRQQYEPS